MRTWIIAASLVGLGIDAAAQGTDPHPTFTVGTATAQRGELAYGELNVPAGSDSGMAMPVAVIHGAKPGPVVAFIAGSHGTEYASVVAMTRLITRVDPTKLSGTVIVMPLLNIASFEQMTVHVNPTDKKGMNSSYPGNSSGTQTERALALVAQQVVIPADVIVDLHGGDMDEDLRPYSYWTRTGNATLDSATKKAALAFGLDHIIVRDLDTSNPATTRSLSSFSLARGKIAIVAEAGRSGTVLTPDVDALVNGALNVLGQQKLIVRAPKPVAARVWLSGGATVRAERPGMFYSQVGRDTRVKKDQVVGYTTDYLGRRTGDVKSPLTGLVTFIRGVPSVWTGATLVSVSEILPVPPPYKKP